jgi:hypothetical protein
MHYPRWSNCLGTTSRIVPTGIVRFTSAPAEQYCHKVLQIVDVPEEMLLKIRLGNTEEIIGGG